MARRLAILLVVGLASTSSLPPFICASSSDGSIDRASVPPVCASVKVGLVQVELGA